MQTALAVPLTGSAAVGAIAAPASVAATQPPANAVPMHAGAPMASAPTAQAPAAAAPVHHAMASAQPRPAVRARSGGMGGEMNVIAELTTARADLDRDWRTAAEHRLDAAATDLLNRQAAERARLGPGSTTKYDSAVSDVVSAFHAARAYELDRAESMVNQAIASLRTAG
jgi:hypothetical protein